LCRLPPDILCLSETRIKEKPLKNIFIPGYQFIHENCPTNAGGVAMYISNSINFQKLKHFNIELAGCENVWINKLSKNKNYVIFVLFHLSFINIYIYWGNISTRTKQNSSSVLDKLAEVLSNLNVTHHKCLMLGDININVDKGHNSPHFINHINTPRRVTFN